MPGAELGSCAGPRRLRPPRGSRAGTGPGRVMPAQPWRWSRPLGKGIHFTLESKMFSVWIVHLAMWLLIQAVTENCKRGDMIANTDSVVLPGSNITLSCRLKQGEQCKEIIFKNSEMVLAYGRHTFSCKCKSSGKIICGIDIYVGNPPDQPENVSCIQYGRDGNPTCTWDKGRLTHIETTYVVQITNETECLSFAEETVNLKYGSLDLTKLNFESNYTAVVAASNRLGNASSLPFTFMLIDIVKPHSPTDILVKFDNFSATNCTVLWQDQQQTQSFKLRYRPINSHSWNMVETLNATSYNLHDLKPHTEYEFQVCCKFHPNRGIWSDWSTFQIQTPEADLPPLQKVSATPMGNDSIFVTWEPPIESVAFINGYVVEWADTHRGSSLEPHQNWIRFPASSLSTIISENIKCDVCYDINVFALYRNRAGPVASTRGYSKQEAPSAGPQVSTAVKGDGVWKEIPGHQQMGCIISYNACLQKKHSEADPKVYGASDWIIVLAACIFISISAYICLVKSAQKALCSLLSVLVPQWYRKAIPDPANCTWAKKYSYVEDELNLHSNHFLSHLSSFEEPETIEVEEVFIKKEPVAFKDLPIFSNIKSSESHDWQTTASSFENQESTEKNSEYKPLSPSIPDDGDNSKCHLPYLYKKVVLEETEQIQTVSGYLASPLTDTTVNYLPSNILSPIMDANEESNEFECKSFSVFPTTSLLMPMFSCGGKLTLDSVKIDCNSITE
ncbi:interleukin-12 receptor subunit beta-2 isoform X3 [Emydura macquarii macquarii]|uniref:interleukin-12 receptor subunit beta-2 isoform X3 n=1 Tax=Emydura macquarii macquarii TaxID=1129001 RepID=UPI00352B56AF